MQQNFSARRAQSIIARRGSTILFLALFALFILSYLSAPKQVAFAAGNITGNVFRDYNANGAKDTAAAGVAGDTGILGVKVTAYDSTDASVATANSDASGNYSLALGSVSNGTPLRIEFTNPPTGYQPSAVGGTNATTVRFVTTTAGAITNINLALNRPQDYCQDNPNLGICIYVFGRQLSSGDLFENSNVLVDFPYTNSGTTAPTNLSQAQYVGTQYGLAYQRNTIGTTSRRLFTAAYMKRHAGFGPDGPGAIYVTQLNASGDNVGNPTLFATIPDAGTDPHPTTEFRNASNQCLSAAGNQFNPGSGVSCFYFDPYSFDPVGKMSLGDLDMYEDPTNAANDALFVVNLNDQKLYKITNLGGTPSVSSGFTMPITLPNTDSTLPDNSLPLGSGSQQHQVCPANDRVEPFGLGFNDGVGYAGFVCTVSSASIPPSQQNIDNLRAYVYTFDPATVTFETYPVVEFPLNYNRGVTDDQLTAPWMPWISSLSSVTGATHASPNPCGTANPCEVSYPQPILSDIVFDNGNMILGLRDRFGDQSGALVGGTTIATTPTYRAVSAGDLLRVCGNPTDGWTLESNGVCGGVTSAGNTAGTQNPQTTTNGNTQGPDGFEYYWRDWVSNQAPSPSVLWHEEITLGGLAQVPGFSDMISAAFDPLDGNAGLFGGGTRRFQNATGTLSTNGGYEIYHGELTDGYFGKANGLGDLEALCNAAPIEIGNRVWSDTNKNGRQDPGENGIANVTLGLYDSNGALVAQVETDSNGNYRFSSASGTDSTGNKYGVNILPNTQYTVAIFSSEFANGGTLAGKYRTTSNFDNQTNNNAFGDIRDSDLVTLTSGVGSDANAATMGVTLTTNVILGAGYNNHSVDFGISASAPTAVDLGVVRAKANKDGTVTLKWESLNESNLIGFNILRSRTRNGAPTQVNAELIAALSVGQLSGNEYSFDDHSAQGGKKYFYRVELVRPNGMREASDSVRVKTKVPANACSAAPQSPTLTSPTNSNKIKRRKATFTWNAVECAATYQWELRADAPDGELVSSKNDLLTPETRVKKLQRGKTYYWRAAACNADAKCAPSEWWNITIKP